MFDLFGTSIISWLGRFKGLSSHLLKSKWTPSLSFPSHLFLILVQTGGCICIGCMLMLVRPWRHASNHVFRLSCTRSLTTSRPIWQTQPATVPDQPNYSDTVHLPKTAMPMANDPSKNEVLRKRTTEDLYRWQVRVLPLLSYLLG